MNNLIESFSFPDYYQILLTEREKCLLTKFLSINSVNY